MTKLKESACIAIVMATYNGSKFILEQILSLQEQSYSNWKLYIRDDCSKDNTVELLRKVSSTDSRIILLDDGKGNLGFNLNFYEALSATCEDYIAFCDQDDVWMPNKLEMQIEEIKKLEKNEQTPALVHADAELVDINLNQIKPRFISSRGNVKGLKGILFANCVQGATMMINRSLANKVINMKPKLPFDYHIAIINELLGKRAYIDKSLIKYRQHDNNAIGAIKVAPSNTLEYKHTLSFLAAMGMYHHIISYLVEIKPQKFVEDELKDYLYIFEGNNRLRKLLIYLKYRYPFSRTKDILYFLNAILKKQDLRNIKN